MVSTERSANIHLSPGSGVGETPQSEHDRPSHAAIDRYGGIIAPFYVELTRFAEIHGTADTRGLSIREEYDRAIALEMGRGNFDLVAHAQTDYSEFMARHAANIAVRRHK